MDLPEREAVEVPSGQGGVSEIGSCPWPFWWLLAGGHPANVGDEARFVTVLFA